MIEIKQIYTSEKADYLFAEKLLISAFPKEERRDVSLQREYTDFNKQFYNNILLVNQEPVGFISYWSFKNFLYIEHFAIDETKRNGGYGKEVLTLLEKNTKLPIVLEVELPENEISKRRIEFYQRQGFRLLKDTYQQPPYREEDNYLPMMLMMNADSNTVSFEHIKSTLYRKVYRVKEY